MCCRMQRRDKRPPLISYQIDSSRKTMISRNSMDIDEMSSSHFAVSSRQLGKRKAPSAFALGADASGYFFGRIARVSALSSTVGVKAGA